MAPIPRSRQKSTKRPSKLSKWTLGNSAVTSASIASRSSTLNRLFFDGLTTTATVTSSNSPEAAATMSRCPVVIGSNDPGQTALCTEVLLLPRITGSATVPKHGLAVAPLAQGLDPLGPFGRRIAPGPLEHDVGVVGQPAASDQVGQYGDEIPARRGVRRVDEHDVVGGVGRAVYERAHRLTDDSPADQAERLGVAPDQSRRPAVPLDQGRRLGTPRQSLESDRAGARVEVQKPAVLNRVERGLQRREQRLAYPLGGRTRVHPGRRLQSAAACRAGDDPGHALSR